MPVDLLGELLGVEMLGNGVSIVTWGVIMMTKRMMAMRMVQVLDAWGLARGTPWGGNVGEWGNCHFLLPIMMMVNVDGNDCLWTRRANPLGWQKGSTTTRAWPIYAYMGIYSIYADIKWDECHGKYHHFQGSITTLVWRTTAIKGPSFQLCPQGLFGRQGAPQR